MSAIHREVSSSISSIRKRLIGYLKLDDTFTRRDNDCFAYLIDRELLLKLFVLVLLLYYVLRLYFTSGAGLVVFFLLLLYYPPHHCDDYYNSVIMRNASRPLSSVLAHTFMCLTNA